jgi:hypothetical protein
MMPFHHTTGRSFDPSPALLAVVLMVPLTIDFSCLFAPHDLEHRTALPLFQTRLAATTEFPLEPIQELVESDESVVFP